MNALSWCVVVQAALIIWLSFEQGSLRRRVGRIEASFERLARVVVITNKLDLDDVKRLLFPNNPESKP